MQEIQPIIDRHVADMHLAEVNLMLTKYPNYLRIDVGRDLLKHKEVAQSEAAIDFDNIFNTGTDNDGDI